jgi:hypothetical protein
MKKYIIVILLVLNAAIAWGLNNPEGIKAGDWSSAAYFVWPLKSETTGELHISSPDGKRTAIIQDNNLTLVTKKNIGKNKSDHKIYLDGLAEIG